MQLFRSRKPQHGFFFLEVGRWRRPPPYFLWGGAREGLVHFFLPFEALRSPPFLGEKKISLFFPRLRWNVIPVPAPLAGL